MEIYDEILKSLDEEPHVMLATIIATTGSTPASAHSKMLVKRGGIISVGTVGGGCMEGDVITQAHRLYEESKAGILRFQLNEDDVEHGLICGGNVDVLLEPISRTMLPLFRELRERMDEGLDSLLCTILGNDNSVKGKILLENREATPELKGFFGESIGEIDDLLQATYRRQETLRFRTDNGELIVEPISGTPQLVIFGGGHVSKYLCRFASSVGFRVTVVDDRPQFAAKERFPEAVETIAVDFPESWQRLPKNPSRYIVIVTRGHRHDEEVLERAITVPARYIGMIGSRKKVLTTFQHILSRGGSKDALSKVHAPVGLEIGATTAEEIAVSIVAELIRIRRGPIATPGHKSEQFKDAVHTLKSSVS
ncbi:MAG TPA: XdhC family protein [Bacteroidota bacterium]|nr:XdhC family protein [Bacteroidota bacterium]